MTWTRQGECNHCGFCCLFFATEPHMLTFPKSGIHNKYGGFDAPHAQVRGLQEQGDGNMVVPAWFYSPCSAFQTDELRCAIQETKPEMCKDYPWAPDQIVGTPCSYWFETVEGVGGAPVTIYRQGGQGSQYPGRSAERDGQTLADASAYFNVPYPIIAPLSLLTGFREKINAQAKTIIKLIKGAEITERVNEEDTRI